MSNNPTCSCLFFSIFFAASFILKIQSASTPVTWTSNSYFVSGKFTFTPSTSGSVNQLVTVPYGSALTAAPTRLVALGLVDYEFKYSVPYYYFILILDSYSQTGVTAHIVCDYDTDLVTLVVSYLTVDPSFIYPFSISYFTTSSSPAAVGPLNLMYYINFTASTGVILDLTHQNGMLAFQHIMDLSSTDDCYQVDIVFRIFNQSFYEVVITSNCSTMSLYQFGFSRIIFDKTAIEALGYCYFQFGELIATNGDNTPLTFTTSPFFANNFMLGMKSFSLQLNKFKFRCNIGSTTTVSNTGSYKYLSFMYWSFRWRVCPTGYPYFQPATGLCYDACPNGFYPNLSIQMCQPCSYSCTTCSSYSVCTNCDPLTNRYLNGTSCLPNSGYFDNGTVNAVICTAVIPNCLYCSDNITCTNCSSGYYVDLLNNTCSACILNCVQCADSASCVTCGISFFYNPITNACVTCAVLISNCVTCASATTTTCITCAAGYAIDSTGASCILNPCTDLNCAQCLVNQSVCEICITGFNISSSFTCITVCGDSITAGAQGCDDGNNVDGDGCNADCTIGNNNSCPASSPYKDPLTNLCASTCPTGFFADLTSFTCQPCLYSCLTCSTNSTCQTCSSANKRTLNGTDCLPLPGFYDNFTADAKPCTSPCVQCTSATSCTTCIVGNYLSVTSCLTCSSSISFCAQCTPTGLTCTLCQAGYSVNATTGACDIIPCYDINCLLCPDSMSFCTQCTQGYQSVNGICQTICGDFIKVTNQQCDDGNSISKDGCSDTCTIESQFTCQTNPNNTLGSACYYIGAVTVDLKYIQKIDGQNKIKIVLDLSPNDLTFWDTVDFLSMISMQSPVPISGVDIIKNQDGTVDIIFQYESDIQGQQINITVSPANSGLPGLSRAAPSSNSVIIDPNDNQGAYFYDQNTYKIASVVSALSTGVAGVALGFFVLGAISGKMVGVEMMAVVQISFFSLMTLTELNPCFAALSSLKLVNGYNSLNKNSLEDPLNPIQPKGIFLFSRFVENFNFTTAVILIPLIIALIAFILSKTACKDNQRVQAVFKKSVGEYTLMGLLFGEYIISVSFALEIMYGVKNTSDMVGKISLVECSILIVMILGYFVFLLLKPEYFGQFTESFKKDKLSSKYYNFMVIERIMLGACLVVMLPIALEGVVPSAVFLLTGAFVIVKKPYKQNYHNYRVVANMAISIVVEVVYLVYKITSPEQRNKPIFIYLPLIVCILLLVCVLYNSAAIVYSIYKYFRNENLQTDLEKQERDQIAKFRNESMVAKGSPDSLKSGVPLNEQSASPLNLRKDIDFKNIKKQIAKINTTINEPGLANSLMLFKDNPVNQEDILEYDAI